MANKRNAGRKSTTRTDEGLRADRRERNQEFQVAQNSGLAKGSYIAMD